MSLQERKNINQQRVAILFILPVPGSISGFLAVQGRLYPMLRLSRGPMGTSALFTFSLHILIELVSSL